MDVIILAAGFILFVILLGVGIAAMLSSAAGKRKEERLNRYIADQPWDARTTNSRGNR